MWTWLVNPIINIEMGGSPSPATEIKPISEMAWNHIFVSTTVCLSAQTICNTIKSKNTKAFPSLYL